MPDIRRDDAGGVITVTFTRDGKRNAVSGAMFDVLERAVTDLADDPAQRVLVITAEGRYFTSGIDIAELGAVAEGGAGRRQYRRHAHHDLYDEIEQIEKPVVLAAQGPCFGVGVELGVSCDFRLASDVATFCLPEIANLAVIPGSGGISRLTRLVGPHWARWLAMAGQTIDADQALHIGLVHAVHPATDFADEVQAFARHLARLPAEAVGLAKIAIDTAAAVDRRTAREFDRLAQSTLFQSPDYLARVDAFLDRGKQREVGQPAVGMPPGKAR